MDTPRAGWTVLVSGRANIKLSENQLRTVGVIAAGIVLDFVLHVCCGMALFTYFYVPNMRHHIPLSAAVAMLSPVRAWLMIGSMDIAIGGSVGLLVGLLQKSRAALVASLCLIPSFLFELHYAGFNWSCWCVLQAILSPSLHQGLRFAISIGAATVLSKWKTSRATAVQEVPA